ncbi:MAG: hypothetical protein U1A27_13165 [Phycisphaerae bacterium]
MIVLGAITRNDMDGRGVTRAEVLVTALALAGAAVAVGAYWRSNASAARRTNCLSNLTTIGAGLLEYTLSNGGRWPYVAKLPTMDAHQPRWPSLPQVLEPWMRGRDSAYRCPADRRTLAAGSPLVAKFGQETTYYQTEGLSYEWMLGELYGGQAVGKDPLARADGLGMGPADQPVLGEFEPFHEPSPGAASFNVLYADFHARPMRGAARGATGLRR